MMEKKQQFFRAFFHIPVYRAPGFIVLGHIPGPIFRPVHTDSMEICPVIGSPAVVFITIDIRSVVIVRGDHPANSQGRIIFFVCPPGAAQHGYNNLHNIPGTAKGQSGPLPGDLLRTQGCIHRQASKSIQICRRKIISRPVFIIPGIDHTGNATQALSITLPGDYPFHGSSLSHSIGIKRENLLPHRNQIAEIDLLSSILLGDLHLKDHISLFEPTKQW